MAPIYATGNHFVVGLKENAAIAEIVEEGVNGRLDVQRVEPEGEDASFTLAFRIEVFDLEFLFFSNRVEAGVSVEKVSNEGEVEFGVSGYKRGRRKELAAVQSVSILKNLFGTLEKVSGLEGATAAKIWSQLVEENSVIVAFFNVR